MGWNRQITLPEPGYEQKNMDILKGDTATTNPPFPWIKGMESRAASSVKFPPLPYIFSSPNTSLLAGRKAPLIDSILFYCNEEGDGKK